MAIPAYKNISGFSIDVPLDCGATQRVPPGYFVKGTYFLGVFDAHRTVIDGVSKNFPADPNWEKTADWTGLSAADKAKIVVDNLPGYGNRLQLVNAPAYNYSVGIKGWCAFDDAGAFYLCTETGDNLTTPTQVTDEAVGTGGVGGTATFDLDHLILATGSNLDVKLDGVTTAAYTTSTVGGVTRLTFSPTVAEGVVVTASYIWAGPAIRWAKGTLSTSW